MVSHASASRRYFLSGSAALLAAAAVAPRPIAAARRRHPYGIVGQPAPEIELDYWIDRSGQAGAFSVRENRGKWVFLKCFQDWCPGCHASGFPTLQRFAAEFADHPQVAIAGIQTVFEGYAANTREDVRKLQLRYGLPVTMGHDPGDRDLRLPPQTMQKYRTGGTPWLILIAPHGRVLFNDYRVNTDRLIEYVRGQVG